MIDSFISFVFFKLTCLNIFCHFNIFPNETTTVTINFTIEGSLKILVKFLLGLR